MRSRTALWGGLGLGVAVAFLFDPVSGRRRRRRISDAAGHLAHLGTRTSGSIRRDLRNRTSGLIARVRRRISQDRPDDVVLEERVRSAIGHVVANAHDITVSARDGHITLDGPMLSSDDHRLTYIVRAIPGVKRVDTQFNRHLQPAAVRSRL
jgi:DNA-binding Lrp family transcriptional regulator